MTQAFGRLVSFVLSLLYPLLRALINLTSAYRIDKPVRAFLWDSLVEFHVLMRSCLNSSSLALATLTRR